jgi:4,5-dihydroxyphthalate decarboxylase
MEIQLSLGVTPNPRTIPVIEGKARADGIHLVPTVRHPSELFWRQLRFSEFDVSEISLSGLMMLVARGDERFIGLPIFTTRRFFHTGILVRRSAGIERPQDLKGKRVGIPEYQQTAALWIRAALQHEFGVEPKDMEFWMERAPSQSHGAGTGFKAPPGVTIHTIPQEKSIGSMMLSGELDAVLFYLTDANLIDRSRVDLANHPDIKPLFPDPLAEGVRYYRKTGIYPINHTMVIKRKVAEQHPWAMLNILKAFNDANEAANQERIEQTAYHIETGLLPAEAAKTIRTSLIQHGVGANRQVLEAAAKHSLEQGLTPRLIKVEELFAPSTQDH